MALLASSLASAKYDWRVRSPNLLWKQECSACHVAYMPKWLSADNWRGIMQSLDRHFGANASLDKQPREEITEYLLSHAAWDRGGLNSAESLRVTDTPWFLSGHGRGAQRLWGKRPVGNAADCSACHKGPDVD